MNLPDWRPAADWPTLRRRAELYAHVRRFFDVRGCVEVDTPLLSADTVVDRHLDPVECTLSDDPCEPHRGRRLFLQTSPEFAMKRLLAAAGPDAPRGIYQIAHAVRAGERGPRHNPEFALLEWYRLGDDYAAGQDLLAELAGELFGLPVERIRYREALQRWAGVDPLTDDGAALNAAVERLGIAAPVSLAASDRDGWLDLLLTEAVEPQLGAERPLIVFDYPPSQAALARVRQTAGEPAVAERFELYFRGLELANGYHELLDAEQLLARAQANNVARSADGKPALPVESRLLAAMRSGLPVCTGVALGLDRVLMLLVSAADLRDVLAFPIDRA